MDIGTLITKRIDDGRFKQAAVAARYVERAKARKIERNQSTVESHLSRLKSNDRTAVQYFFADPRDAEDLLEALAFPAGERGAVLGAADALLSPEERPLRLVVDLTTGPQDRGFVELCETLWRQLLDDAPPRVALVMTQAQHENLLPRFAPVDRVRVEVVQDPSQGDDRTRALAGDAAVVLSTRRFPVTSRWIAARWPERSNLPVTLEPTDALAALRAGTPLPGDDALAPALGHDLAALAPDAAPAVPPKEYAPDAPSLRRLIVSLAKGEAVRPHPDGRRHSAHRDEASPADRQAWAQHLGVRALATDGEWLEHLVLVARDAGATDVIRGGAGALQVEIDKAERGARTPRVVVEGAAVHVINPAPATAERLRALAGLTVHEVMPRASAVGSLRTELATRSKQALLDDPHLDGLIESLVAQGGDRAELTFVAACMLNDGAVRPEDAPRLPAWHDALVAVLALDPPAVGLRLPRGQKEPHGGEFGTVVLRAPDGFTLDRDRDWDQDREPEVAGVPAAELVRLRRGERLWLGTSTRDGYFSGRQRALPRGLNFEDGFAVSDAFARSPFRTKRQGVGEAWRVRPLTLASGFWEEADRHLAVTWLALRRAARQAASVTLHDGTGVLDMGGGVVAEVSAYEVPPHPRASPCEADFLLPIFTGALDDLYGEEGLQADAVWGTLATGSADTDGHVTTRRTRVPHALFFARDGIRLIVTFRENPWDGPADDVSLRAAAKGARRRDEQAHDDD
jgi:hypothetical protein